MKVSSAAAGKPIKKTGNSRHPVSHHKNIQCAFSELEKEASLYCKTQLQSSILIGIQIIKKCSVLLERKQMTTPLGFCYGTKGLLPFL